MAYINTTGNITCDEGYVSDHDWVLHNDDESPCTVNALSFEIACSIVLVQFSIVFVYSVIKFTAQWSDMKRNDRRLANLILRPHEHYAAVSALLIIFLAVVGLCAVSLKLGPHPRYIVADVHATFWFAVLNCSFFLLVLFMFKQVCFSGCITCEHRVED
jgi:hypothetical protein